MNQLNRVMPALADVQELARGYQAVPVYWELPGEVCDPLDLFCALRSLSKHCFLLDSAEEAQRGRYTFLGFDPKAALSYAEGILEISNGVTTRVSTADPASYIAAVLEDYRSPQLPGLPPLTGGLVGYFAYDYIAVVEPSLKLTQNDAEGLKDIDLMLFDRVIAYDHLENRLLLIATIKTRDLEVNYGLAEHELRALAELVTSTGRAAAGATATSAIDVAATGEDTNATAAATATSEDTDAAATATTGDTNVAAAATSTATLGPPPATPTVPPPPIPKPPKLRIEAEFRELFNADEYARMVETAKQYIYDGDIFQVVLSNRLVAPASGSLFETYRVLRESNPSPYQFYFASDDIELAGASPETLVKLIDGVVQTFPLAGTRPRGATAEEDLRLEQDLLGDEKELAEHTMLVDLGRNDIGKVSDFGTVEVGSFLDVLRFSHVMHIGSAVQGRLAAGKTAMDVVSAVLPAGTLSGAPKIRACEIINELEDNRRGIYGGAIGYLGFNGNLDTCIAIRLVFKKRGMIFVRSGAGIVADSDPASEYRECKSKMAAVLEALKQVSE